MAAAENVKLKFAPTFNGAQGAEIKEVTQLKVNSNSI